MKQSKPDAPTLINKIQTYAIVTVVTVLIWLYLESENVKLQKPLRLTVSFVAPPGQQLLIIPARPSQTPTQPTKLQVDITVSCATSQYVRLQRLQDRPLELTVTEYADHPIQFVDLRQMLLDTPIGDLGVTLDEIVPPKFELRVERIEQVSRPIRVVVAEGIQLATTPVVEPAECTVGLPASVAQHVDLLLPQVSLERQTANTLDPNVPRELSVPITLAVSEDLEENLQKLIRINAPQIRPPNATMTVTIRNQTGSLKIPGVPIVLAAPWAEMKKYTVEIEKDKRVLEEVRVTGPSDVIDRIDKGQLKVWADLRLTADDLESRITSKQVHINVPPGVQVESPIPRLNFLITPLVTPEPPTTP